MPEYFIPLQESIMRPPTDEKGEPIGDGKTWAVLPILLHDDHNALAELPDGEYHLVKIVTDADNKLKSASIVSKRKKVKTPQVTSKVSEV